MAEMDDPPYRPPGWKRRAQALNDTRQAAALSYDRQQDNAPRLVAHGSGHIADRIMEIAAEHNLPIRNDPTLVSILGALDVGAEIPPDLYGVIAEVLAWAYQTDQVAGRRRQRRAA
jgi:flagellar biosynthesis protein